MIQMAKKSSREVFKYRSREEQILTVFNFIDRFGVNATYGKLLGLGPSRNAIKPIILNLVEKDCLQFVKRDHPRRGGGASSRLVLVSTDKGKELQLKVRHIVEMLTPKGREPGELCNIFQRNIYSMDLM